MSALQRVKAYFGMIPAEEAYEDEPEPDGDARGARDGYERYAPELAYGHPSDGYRGGYAAGGYSGGGYPSGAARHGESAVPVRGRMRARSGDPAVHGALAMDREVEPSGQLRSVPEQHPARDPLSRIVTLHPSGYGEARAVGEHFRDGNPVIMNLTEMDSADAKRLVDFAAGLAFALQGSIDKVTGKVFLLSPRGEDVSDDERRRIAEGGLFLRR